ncbi:MAG: TIGR01777 family oxidoreductase [Candidatus Marsarchaeota archaeon]|nr:TIGR01777 family oxidoreductase [Candidatus Marsarchaeota archaeon]
MKVLVSGASGFIGSALVAELTLAGHEVYTLGRSSSDDPKKLSWNIESRTGSLKSIDSLDGVIHLSGESLASKRWTPIQKQKIINSRLEGTDFLIHLLSEANLKPEVFVAGSAVGVYGDRGDEILDESSTPGNGFLSSLTLDWEQRARGAESVASRIALVRTGLVLSNYGGALAKQLPLFKYGLGTILGNGGQYLSWIHLEDEVRAIIHTLTNPEISGPVNLVSPNPVTNREFAKTLAAVLQRPLFLNAPAFVLELALGKEFADEMLLVSQRVTPTALKEAGFEFLFPNLEDALSDLLR